MATALDIKQVPFFNYGHVYGQYEKKFLQIFKDIAKRGAFIHQKENKAFEENLAKFLKAEYALGVANCTDGLILALRAAGVKPGDEVIFSSHTFVATASAIHHAGAIPIPVDCGDDHLIDPKAIKAAITPRTTAIIPTQLNGHVCDMDAIMEICKKHNLILVEDAAQSLGATWKKKHAGTFGAASAYSFYPAKVVGCFGDGGAVVTNDKDVYEKVFLTRDHGRAQIGEVVTWGLNSRLDNLQAAFLDYKLSKYGKDIKRRREIATLYQEGLGDLSEMVLPRAPKADNRRFEVYQNYEVEAEAEVREKLRDFLKQRGIGTILQWGGKAVHEFEGLGLNYSLPNTERLMQRMFLLPMHTALTNEEITYIIKNIREFYGK